MKSSQHAEIEGTVELMSFEGVYLCDFESVDLKVSFLNRHFEQNFCDLQNPSWSKLPCSEIDSVAQHRWVAGLTFSG